MLIVLLGIELRSFMVIGVKGVNEKCLMQQLLISYLCFQAADQESLFAFCISCIIAEL